MSPSATILCINHTSQSCPPAILSRFSHVCESIAVNNIMELAYKMGKYWIKWLVPGLEIDCYRIPQHILMIDRDARECHSRMPDWIFLDDLIASEYKVLGNYWTEFIHRIAVYPRQLSYLLFHTMYFNSCQSFPNLSLKLYYNLNTP